MDRTELSFINLINLQLPYDRPDLVERGEGIPCREEYSEIIYNEITEAYDFTGTIDRRV